MAEEKKKESELKNERISLKSIPEIMQANEWLFNAARNGLVDGKSFDGMNTVIKSQTYLKAGLAIQMYKLQVMAHKAKMQLTIPSYLLPEVPPSPRM